MLNAVIDYLPSPLDVKPIVGHRAENPDEEVIAKATIMNSRVSFQSYD